MIAYINFIPQSKLKYLIEIVLSSWSWSSWIFQRVNIHANRESSNVTHSFPFRHVLCIQNIISGARDRQRYSEREREISRCCFVIYEIVYGYYSSFANKDHPTNAIHAVHCVSLRFLLLSPSNEQNWLKPSTDSRIVCKKGGIKSA